MRKALFLDRDGVINDDSGYVHNPTDFHFKPGIFDLCRLAIQRGFVVIVITNQSGLARGHFTLAEFQHLTQWMLGQFAERGVELAGVYHCPHHPLAIVPALSLVCSCRKPAPGLINQASQDFNVSKEHSLMVGDQERDLEAASRAGIATRVLLSLRAQQSGFATHQVVSLEAIGPLLL